MLRRAAFCTVTYVVLFLSISAIARADIEPKVYWTAWTRPAMVQRANLDGTGVETLVTGLNAPWPIEIDPVQEKMYWGDVNEGEIQRANLDGTNVETIAVGVPIDNPAGLAIDPLHQELYWSDFVQNKIFKTDLTTHATTTLVTGLTNPFGLALDLTAGKLYWADSGVRDTPGKIQRANLDGTSVEDLVTGLSNPRDVALDLVGGKIFWPDVDDEAILRANLDGSEAGVFISTETGACWGDAVAVDHMHKKLYWTSRDGVCRANLDGSGIEFGIVPFNNQFGAAVVPEPSTLTLLTMGALTLTIGWWRKRKAPLH